MTTEENKDYEWKRTREENMAPVMETEPTGGDEIDLIELLYWLIDHWKQIAIVSIACAAIAALYTFFLVTPEYQATAKLYVVNSKDSAINLSDLQIGSFLTSDYQEVFKTWEVHENVLTNLKLDYTYKELEAMLSIKNPTNTRILNISVTDSNPYEATLIANEYAMVTRQYISDKMATESPSILSRALEPTEPISPNKTMNILLGLLVGLLLSAGFFVVRFVLDDKVKTAEDLRKYAGMETLAVIHEMESEKPHGVKKRKGVEA